MNILYLALMSTLATLSGSVEQNQSVTNCHQLNAQIDQNTHEFRLQRPVITVQIHDNISKQTPSFGQYKLDTRNLQSSIQHEQSAMGIEWDSVTHIVRFVDSHSDLYGKIYPGDTFLSMDGIDPSIGLRQRRNYGTEQRVIQTVFSTRNYGVIALPCQLHPISWFCQSIGSRLSF